VAFVAAVPSRHLILVVLQRQSFVFSHEYRFILPSQVKLAKALTEPSGDGE
jgi:hypothetical protein